MQIPTLNRYSCSQNSQEDDGPSKTQIYGSKSTLADSAAFSAYQTSPTSVSSDNMKLYSSGASYKNNSICQQNHLEGNNVCIEHFKKFHYTCITCNQSICSDCLSNPANHRGHRFQRFSEKKEDWRTKRVEISAKINFKKDHCYQNIKHLQFIQQQSKRYEQQKITKLQNHIQNIKQSKIECPFELQHQFNDHKQIYNKFSSFHDSCLMELKSTTKVGLIINKGVEINDKIANKMKQVEQFQISVDQPQIDNQLKPNFYTNIFTLKSFSKMREQKQQIILQNFNAYQSLWRIKAYPAGYDGVKYDEKYKGIQYMSLYVERLDGLVEKSSYVVQIQFTSRTDPRLRIKKQFQSQYTRNESWGYDRFTRVSNLFDHGFLGFDDTLFMKVSITPANYYQANRGLGKIIDEKHAVLQQNQRRIKALRALLEKKRQNQITQSRNRNERCQIQEQLTPQSMQMQQKIEQVNEQNNDEKIEQKTEYKIEQKIIIEDMPTAQSQCPTSKSINNIEIKDQMRQAQNLRIQEHKLNPESQRFRFGVSNKLKQEIKSKLDTRAGVLGVSRSRTTHYPQISLQKSPGKLIRLVSLKNIELMQNSRKLLFNRSATNI